MDIITKGDLWDYWKIGGDEIEVSDDEYSDLEEYWSDKEETAEIFKIETDVFYYETPLCLAFNKFNYILKVDPDLLTKDIMGWIEDGYCNGGNLPSAYHIENSLHYQDLEWYEALEDSELKDEALRNKAIMEGLISDDESCNDYRKIWKSHEINYHDYNEGEYENETYDDGHKLCGIKTREAQWALKDQNIPVLVGIKISVCKRIYELEDSKKKTKVNEQKARIKLRLLSVVGRLRSNKCVATTKYCNPHSANLSNHIINIVVEILFSLTDCLNLIDQANPLIVDVLILQRHIYSDREY
ncbi:hypothetical protein Tco_0851785 [Tanacetum coccineum]